MTWRNTETIRGGRGDGKGWRAFMGNGWSWLKVDTCLNTSGKKHKKKEWFALRRRGILRTQTWNDRHGENSRGFLLPHRLS